MTDKQQRDSKLATALDKNDDRQSPIARHTDVDFKQSKLLPVGLGERDACRSSLLSEAGHIEDGDSTTPEPEAEHTTAMTSASSETATGDNDIRNDVSLTTDDVHGYVSDDVIQSQNDNEPKSVTDKVATFFNFF